MDTWASITIAATSSLAAIASAIAAFLSLRVSTRAFRWQRSQSAPKVIIRTYTTLDAPTCIYVQIENIGQEPAFDIKFKSSTELKKGFGFAPIDPESAQPLLGPIATGIPALAAGDYRELLWGQYGGLHSLVGDGFIRIDCEFSDSQQILHSTPNFLEVKSYEHTNIGDNRPLSKIVQELSQLRTEFKDLITKGVVVEHRKEYVDRLQAQREETARKKQRS